MKNIISVVLSCLFLVVSANPVDSVTAKNIAISFLQTHSTRSMQKSTIEVSLAYKATSKRKSNENQVYYYVFNTDNNAYVIVTGTDRTLPILGYSFESSFNPNQIPDNVLSFLYEYEREIDYILTHNISASTETQQAWNDLNNKDISIQKNIKSSVAPLVTTKWSQSPYYNAACPYDSKTKRRAVTGCVATTMAQVIKYWEFPQIGYSDHSYVHHYFGELSADFKNTTYRYDLMPHTLNSQTTSDSVNAVATLIYHCGVAVEMDYGVDASGAYIDEFTVGKQSAEYAMRIYYGYSDVKSTSRYALGNIAWTNLLKRELSEGRPLIYRGQGDGGGHAFVCDGYDANDYFHFNWGWNGSYDGYFILNSLNPGPYYDFTSYQGAVYNIYPPNKSGDFHLVLYSDLQLSTSTLDCEEPFSLTTKILNNGEFDFQGDLKISILNGAGHEMAQMEILENQSIQPNVDTLITFQSEGIGGISTGAYKVKVYYRKTNDTLWNPVVNIGSYVNEAVLRFEGEVVVFTDSVSDVESQSAKLYASFAKGCASVVDKGFKWKKEYEQSYNTVFVEDSLFVFQLSDLEPNTTYKVRAYVTTYASNTYGTILGEEVSFTTTPMGVENIETADVNLFPNPAKDCFYIIVDDGVKINKIELINTLGSLVLSVTPTQDIIHIHTNYLASGMYYVNIYTNLSVLRKKVYIE